MALYPKNLVLYLLAKRNKINQIDFDIDMPRELFKQMARRVWPKYGFPTWVAFYALFSTRGAKKHFVEKY